MADIGFANVEVLSRVRTYDTNCNIWGCCIGYLKCA